MNPSVEHQLQAEQMLSSLIARLTATPIRAAGVGGTTELYWAFPCIGKVYGDGLMLGSCVILRGGRIALTASHVVHRPRCVHSYAVQFDYGSKGTHSHLVKRIHWRSGDLYDRANGNWPSLVETYVGKHDRLAALEFETPIDVLPANQGAYLPNGKSPLSGDILVCAGFGEDADGNHPGRIWVGVTRFQGYDLDRFAIQQPRRTDFFNGMPRAGDSGAAVFCPPMSDPLPPNNMRLVGVHSGRKNTLQGEIGLYIPIDSDAEDWIRHVDEIASQNPPSTPIPTPVPTPTCDFWHRRHLACYHFPANLDQLHDLELDLTTKGQNKLLVHQTKMKLTVEGDNIRMRLQQPDGRQREVVLMAGGVESGGVIGRHWYTNDVVPSTGIAQDCYYLFLVDSGPRPRCETDRRRQPVVHIEAFLADSTQPRPSHSTIWDKDRIRRPFVPEIEPRPFDSSTNVLADAIFVQDQDDEGNGHDPP